MNRSQPCGAKHEGQNHSDSGENRFTHRSNIARTKQKSRILSQAFAGLEVGVWTYGGVRTSLSAHTQSLIPFESVDDQWDLRVQERKPSDEASQMLTADETENLLNY